MDIVHTFLQVYVADALLALGALAVLTGTVGLIRLPDFYTRLHAAGVIDSMAMLLVIGGLMLKAGLTLVTAKLFLLLLFLLFTCPTACHALAKSALLGGLRPLGKLRDGTEVAVGRNRALDVPHEQQRAHAGTPAATTPGAPPHA